MNIAKNFKNTYFEKHLQTAASIISCQITNGKISYISRRKVIVIDYN